MIRACIFDLDGTLTDTLESICYSVNLTLKEMKLTEITEEQCRAFVGNGARYLMERAVRAGGDAQGERIEEAMEIYGRIFDDNCTYHVKPYGGIPEVLDRLRGQGVKLAVLSNKPHRQTRKVVEEIFGSGVFDAAQGQMEGVERKPAPDGVLRILKDLGITREECLYVGDSEVDVATGKNAGTETVSVTWGFRTREELLRAGAKHLIDRPEELPGFVGR